MIAPQQRHLEAFGKLAKSVPQGPALEFLVVTAAGAAVHVEPNASSRTLLDLKKGDVVRGFPADDWVLIDLLEAARSSASPVGEGGLSEEEMSATAAWMLASDLVEVASQGPSFAAPYDIIPPPGDVWRGSFTSLGANSSISTAQWWKMFHASENASKFGSDGPDEPLIRVLVSDTTPPFFLMELNATSTFNMMDPGLTTDTRWAIRVIDRTCSRSSCSRLRPQAHLTTGAGPHFCAGGNPNPKIPPGASYGQLTPFHNYVGFTGQRASGCPTFAAVHGSTVGGGVAYSVSANMRALASNATVSYGNLSRGAVPGMLLSRNLPVNLGLSEAFNIYLTESTISAGAAMKANYALFVSPTLPALKRSAVATMSTIITSPFAMKIPLLRDTLSLTHFTSEAVGIDIAGRTGELFAGAKAGAKKKEEEAGAEAAAVEDKKSKKTKPK